MNHGIRLPLLLLPLLFASRGSAAEPVFYARDGSASYPDATIPYDFDGATGKHIKWKAPLPNWSNSDPIVDAGKVFVLSEPVKGYAPFLLCFDAASGKELWRRELDPVTCLPAGEQQAVRTFVQETWDWWRHQESLWSEAHLLREEHKAAFKGEEPPAAIAARWKAIKQEVEAAGCAFAFKSGAGGPSAPFRLADKNRRTSPEARQIERPEPVAGRLAGIRDLAGGRLPRAGQLRWPGLHGHAAQPLRLPWPRRQTDLATAIPEDRLQVADGCDEGPGSAREVAPALAGRAALLPRRSWPTACCCIMPGRCCVPWTRRPASRAGNCPTAGRSGSGTAAPRWPGWTARR